MNTDQKITEQLRKEETLLTPTLESRLNQLLGAAQALWHVSNEIEEKMDQDALMFIHEALIENVRAIRAGLYKCEDWTGMTFSIPCPTLYHD